MERLRKSYRLVKKIEWITPALGLPACSATSIIARCTMLLMAALSELRVCLISTIIP